MIPAQFTYAAPSTLEEAVALLQEPEGALVLAGGQYLLTELKLRRRKPPRLVDLRRVPGLSAITRRLDGGLTIGSMTTCADMAAHAELRAGAQALAEAARQVGDMQVRNRATLGGNLAAGHPAADLPASLMVLEATIQVVGPCGQRALPIDQFYLAPFVSALKPGEIITEVQLPPPLSDSTSSYDEIRIPSNSYPICGIAVLLARGERGKVAKCRVAATGITYHPLRLRSVEVALEGREPNKENIAAATRELSNGVTFVTDLFASGEYREHLAMVLSERALARAAEVIATHQS